MERSIPDDLMPDGPTVIGDWGTVEPEEWPCESVLHGCGLCEYHPFPDLDSALSHVWTEHPDREHEPMAHVYAIPADENGEPYATA